MFGPNSAGKSAVKDAWREFGRLLHSVLEPFPTDGLTAVRRMLSYEIKNRDAFVERGGAAPEASEDDVNYRVVLGCQVEEIDTETSTGHFSNSISGKLGWELYGELNGQDVRYVLSNNSGGFPVRLTLQVNDVTVLEFSDYVDAVETGWIEVEELRSLWGYGKGESLSFGLLKLNFGAEPLSSPRTAELKRRALEGVSGCSNPWLHSAIKVDGEALLVRIESHGERRFSSWEESISSRSYRQSNIDTEIASYFGLIDELVDLVNELLHQVEAAISREMDIDLVSGDRQRLKSGDLRAKWPRRLTDARPPDDLAAVHMYALCLGARDSDRWATVFHGTYDPPPQDDLVNDVLRSGLFSPRNYRVRADFSVSTVEVLASRNEDSVGEESVEYHASLYLQDEQRRVLEFDQVGSGVSCALPVLASLWLSPRSWIEQPELHLHPAAQCEMGDAIIRAFNRGRLSVVETHSEHLLLRILRRVRWTCDGVAQDRELQCQPEAIAVLYFFPQPDGSTQIHHLRVTRGGDFMDRWPEGFFEERTRELFDE